MYLHDGQGDAIDFLIDIEGKDVGHAAEVVDHCHDSCLYVLRADVILRTDEVKKLV